MAGNTVAGLFNLSERPDVSEIECPMRSINRLGSHFVENKKSVNSISLVVKCDHQARGFVLSVVVVVVIATAAISASGNAATSASFGG